MSEDKRSLLGIGTLGKKSTKTGKQNDNQDFPVTGTGWANPACVDVKTVDVSKLPANIVPGDHELPGADDSQEDDK